MVFMTKRTISSNKLRKSPLTASLAVLILSLALSLGVASQGVAQPPAHSKKVAPTQQSSPKPSKTDKKSDDKANQSTDKTLDAKAKAALEKEIEASISTAQPVDSLDLLKDPAKFMNKKVTFIGTFNRFADVALDYKKAFRDSRDYVTFFVLRPDVSDRTIPMSELKLFFPRKKSNEVMDLETGDKIQVIGTEFSTALDEPWLDVEHIKIVKKTDKPERKHGPEF